MVHLSPQNISPASPHPACSVRYLIQIVLLMCTLCCGTGCTAWHEAQTVIREADSLDTRGIIYQDTAALQQFICTWDKPGLNLLMHNSLGKAYYYLGRNREDRYQQYVEAAECYIRSDQLHMSDPVRRGRVNSCMESMCARQGDDTLALEFNRRALKNFHKSKDAKYYVNSLLIRSSLMLSISLSAADSIWKEASAYICDSATLGLSYMVRGAYYYAHCPKKLDSALICYKNVESCQMYHTQSCWCASQLMKVYYRLDSLPQAVEYAKYILANSATSAHGIPAYYVLMKQAETENDTQKLGEYAHARTDLQWEMVQRAGQQNQVRQILNYHAHYADRYVRRWWFLFILLCISGYILYVVIAINSRQIPSKFVQRDKSEQQKKEQIYTAEQVEEMLMNFSNYIGAKPEIWGSDCYADFCEIVDLYLCCMADKLHRTYHLSPQDTKICVLTLMGQSRKEMAEKLYRSESSIPKLRSRAAKQIGIDSAHLREFLINFLTK